LDRAKAVSIRPDSYATRKLAAEIISNGGLIAFRTDTFYGLGADPFNKLAVAKIKNLKGRDEAKPILLLIADKEDTDTLVSSRPPLFELLATQLWPGPLTIVLPANTDLPDVVTAGSASIGLRLPDDGEVRALVRACGGKLTATSANPSGGEPATSATQVQDYFSNGIDLIIDGGIVTATQPSTVIDLTSGKPRILREGAVSHAVIEKVLRTNVHPNSSP
jgi:L-threonylcarbamoyladenylate synthase